MRRIRLILWAVEAIIFLVLIYVNFQGMGTSFGTFDYRIPPEVRLVINHDIGKFINEFAEKFDKHVIGMNRTLRKSSVVGLCTSIVGFVLSLIGFIVDFNEAKQKKEKPPTTESSVP